MKLLNGNQKVSPYIYRMFILIAYDEISLKMDDEMTILLENLDKYFY